MSKELDEILQERKLIRRLERSLRKGKQMNLEDKLLGALPSGLVPGNVGNYDDVAWRFTYTVDFNFGTNPTWSRTTLESQIFQNTQEAAFIFGWINRASYDNTTASSKAPLQVLIRDLQSTRQFNDANIPLQMIPNKVPYLAFEVPLIIMPMARMEFQVTSFLQGLQTQTTVGEGKFSISLHGYRVRTNDVQRILSTIFGRA